MWKKLENSQQNCPPLYLNFTLEDGYEINITDYIHIWAVHFSKEYFLQHLKNSNEGLELENDDLYIERGVEMLSNPEKLRRVQSKKEDDGKVLDITITMSFGYAFRLKLKLLEESREFYFYKVTQPLMKSIHDLHSSRNKLRKLLKDKDSELDHYRREGAEISLRHLITPRYNDTSHMSLHKVYEENFGTPDVCMNINMILQKLDIKTLSSNKRKSEDTNKSAVKQEPSTAVKMEQIENGVIKIEPNSAISNPETQCTSVTQNNTVTDNIIIKPELIKTESPRKKRKNKLNF